MAQGEAPWRWRRSPGSAWLLGFGGAAAWAAAGLCGVGPSWAVGAGQARAGEGGHCPPGWLGCTRRMGRCGYCRPRVRVGRPAEGRGKKGGGVGWLGWLGPLGRIGWQLLGRLVLLAAWAEGNGKEGAG